MYTSHSTGLVTAAVTAAATGVIAVTAGCTVDAGQPAPTATPSNWAELRPTVERALAATGEEWERQRGGDPTNDCARVEGSYDDQAMIPESSGTTVVWSGSVPASRGAGDGRRILRDRFERPWRDLGLVTRYEEPGPVFDEGRVVATLGGSQQVILSGAIVDGLVTLDARAACYTRGLPGQGDSVGPGAPPRQKGAPRQ